MEKRSRRRTRDLVTQAASQGLSENEIGCARISMMARSTNAPCKGRIQMRKTNPLHLLKFGLQRTAGPYSWVKLGKAQCEHMFSALPPVADMGVGCCEQSAKSLARRIHLDALAPMEEFHGRSVACREFFHQSGFAASVSASSPALPSFSLLVPTRQPGLNHVPTSATSWARICRTCLPSFISFFGTFVALIILPRVSQARVMILTTQRLRINS